ncbi:MAG: 2TM domain-containing protein [Saprospiraceae bacterium]|nr:2TM domain-containing protein [Saprospiraceae bacterium]
MEARKQEEFYKHLRIYLTVIAIAFISRVFFHGYFGIPSFAFWWGIGVFVHYISVFGWNNIDSCTPNRNYFEDEPNEREAEPLVDQREQRKSWRDRDLV